MTAPGVTPHDEVVAALVAVGRPASGPAIAADRRSRLEYLGVSSPDVRKVAKQKFSFSRLSEPEVLAVWDGLWRTSPYGEVLFAAIEYYLARIRKAVSPDLWPVARHWIERVENWSHADTLAALYSRILEAYPADVYTQLEEWNRSDDEWQRRVSLVSLIHYSGKNAVFLTLDQVLPLVANCLDDDRYYVQKAVGWVLREMGHAYPAEVRAYLEANAGRMSATAFSRAIERRDPAEVADLRAIRKAAAAG